MNNMAEYTKLLIEAHPSIVSVEAKSNRLVVYTNIPSLRGQNKIFYATFDEDTGACVLNDFTQLSEALLLNNRIKWEKHFDLKDTIEQYVDNFPLVKANWIGNGVQFEAVATHSDEYSEMISQLIAVHCTIDGLIGNTDPTPL